MTTMKEKSLLLVAERPRDENELEKRVEGLYKQRDKL